MHSEAPNSRPFSLVEHIRAGGGLDHLSHDDQLELAGLVAYLGDTVYRCENPTGDDLIAALALPDPTLTPLEQWERELTACVELRQVVGRMLAPMVALAQEMRSLLLANQSR